MSDPPPQSVPTAIPAAVPRAVRDASRAGGGLRAGLVLTALAGVVICIVLTGMSVPGMEGLRAVGTSVCTPSAAVNCDLVLGSRWAKIGPLPVALVGLGYFLMLCIWHLFVGPANHAGRVWHWLPLAVNGAGVLASLYFLFVMWVHLPVWCTWCVAAHVGNFALLGLTVAARPKAVDDAAAAVMRPHPSGVRVGAVLGTGAAVVVMAGLIALLAAVQMVNRQITQRYLAATNNADYICWRWSKNPVVEILVGKGDLILGAADAPHTIVVFSDFQCPKCRGFNRFLNDFLRVEFADRLRCVVKHCPIDRECNPHVGSGLHRFACEAARASIAAAMLGTREQASDYYHLLYEHAARLGARPYGALAEQAGLSSDALVDRMGSNAVAEKLADDVALVGTLELNETPVVFLDGRQVSSWHILGERGTAVDAAASIELWRQLLAVSAAAVND